MAATTVVFLVVFLIIRQPADTSQDNNKTSSGVLTARETNYDFGTLEMKNGPVEHIYILENTSNEPVIITKANTSCMCTTGTLIKGDVNIGRFGMSGMSGGKNSGRIAEVAVGETLSVKAGFDPAAHGPAGVGLAQRSIFLETNSKTQPKIELTFRAVVENK